MSEELDKPFDVKETRDLDLVLFIWGERIQTLVSVKHGVKLAEAQYDPEMEGNGKVSGYLTEDDVPVVDLHSRLPGWEDSYEYNTIEGAAAGEADLDPNDGWPGWDVILSYFKEHRYEILAAVKKRE
jgi:hypothetical protein